jgi:glycosyltransferase involved in cell wall biosynthesis
MNRRLRVLFYIGSLDAGGAERQVLELVRHLDRSRFEPLLGLATRQGSLLAEVPADVPIHAFQDVPRSRRFGVGRFLRWTFLAKLLRQERIDIVYERTFLATLDTGPATWWRPTPRISTIVADPAIQMDLYFPRRQWLWRRFARRVYRTASLVLMNSDGLRQQVIEYFGLPPEKVRVMPNVLDVSRLDELAAKPQATDDAGRLRFRILTIGRIDQHKGHRDLLDAIQILVRDHGQSQILWQILGEGPERRALLDDVRRRQFGDHVEWLGIVPNPYPYYRTADVFCLPSLSEGSPNVLIEALALGTPVISTDCPSGPREILEDGRWGTLVPPQNPTALAAAIADRITNPMTWQNRAALAKPVIRQRYDVTTGVRRLEELLIEFARGCI